MSLPAPATEPVHITVVESAGCHFCEDAHQTLADLATRFLLAVATVDARSAHGQELMARHRAAMSPLILIDDTFFSHGRLPRRKLERVLIGRLGHMSESANASTERSHG